MVTFYFYSFKKGDEKMRKEKKYDWLDIIEKQDGRFVVYGYDEYPHSSVLAGQTRKNFLDAFYSLEEAEKAYPDAGLSHSMLQPENSFDHLPDDSDY
jgi:hypothetical protein